MFAEVKDLIVFMSKIRIIFYSLYYYPVKSAALNKWLYLVSQFIWQSCYCKSEFTAENVKLYSRSKWDSEAWDVMLFFSLWFVF